MKLSKKLTTLAIVGAMSATAAVASAANIGLVNMSQVVNSYPGYGALDMKMQQVDAQYRPQIEKKVQEIEKIQEIDGKVVSLGPRILRTETASVVASSIVLYELSDLGGNI